MQPTYDPEYAQFIEWTEFLESKNKRNLIALNVLDTTATALTGSQTLRRQRPWTAPRFTLLGLVLLIAILVVM